MKSRLASCGTSAALAAALTLAPLAGTGCEDLPGGDDPGTQGAVIGGLGGAAAGAMVGGEGNRLVGALLGGALGAGGGYLIGANMDDDEVDESDRVAAQDAVEEARTNPATVAQVYDSETADLNNDGFVTTDELIAMSEAGLSNQQIIDRLEATDQVFDLDQQQRDYLLANGVSRGVVNRLPTINQEQRDEIFGAGNVNQGDIISEDADDADRI